MGPAAAEAWRLFNSVAGRAAYTASLCESLQDLTRLAMEYKRFSGSPNPLQDEEEEEDVMVDHSAAGSRGNNPVSAGESPSVLENVGVNMIACIFVA